MLTVEDILGPAGSIARRLAHYEQRPQQLEMARLITEAIAERKHAIVEAGTGVGKSLAYLVPAVLAATADQVESPVPADVAVEDDWDEDRDEPAAARRRVAGIGRAPALARTARGAHAGSRWAACGLRAHATRLT